MKLEIDQQGSQVSSLGKKCSEHGPAGMGVERGGSEKQERAIDRICCREKILDIYTLQWIRLGLESQTSLLRREPYL